MSYEYINEKMLGINVIFILILVPLFLYYHGTKTFNYFEKRGVKYIKPVPYFGNTMQSTLSHIHSALCFKDIYNKTKGENVIGFFINRTPVLLVRNPNLIERILVKDFSYFHDRGRDIDERLEPLRAYSIANLTGKRWRVLRHKLAPAFSSGKLKMMFQQFNECGLELIQYLKYTTNDNETIDAGEVMQKFTTDVIGTCAFGMQFNSLRDPNSFFRKLGREILTASFEETVKMILNTIHSKLPSVFNLRKYKKEYNTFFTQFVKDIIKEREENNIERNDFIQILINLSKKNLSIRAETKAKDFNSSAKINPENEILLDEKVLAANTFGFFVGGFETTASTLRNCLFELSLSHNLKLQERLRKDIFKTINNHDNKITVESVKGMPYLDCVISETLRKYPVNGTLFRICTKPYNIPGTTMVLRKGEKVVIPTYAIHYDPDYYPEPDLFDPERFNEENKKLRPRFTYLPFGDGPRSCIASRFALLEIKTGLVNVLSHYEVVLNEKTKLPMRWDPRKTLLAPIDPIYINFKPL